MDGNLATRDGFAKGKCDGFSSSLDSWSDGGGLLSVLTTDSEMSVLQFLEFLELFIVLLFVVFWWWC